MAGVVLAPSRVNIVIVVGNCGGLVSGSVENQIGVFPLICTRTTRLRRKLLSVDVLLSDGGLASSVARA